MSLQRSGTNIPTQKSDFILVEETENCHPSVNKVQNMLVLGFKLTENESTLRKQDS